MTEKAMSFTKFMQTLRSAEVWGGNVSGIEFLIPDEDSDPKIDGYEGMTPFVVLTPCLNIRNKNFVALFRDEASGSLELSSIYITEDCPAIFDKSNRSEFFDAIRQGVTSIASEIVLLAYSTNGLSWKAVGNRMQVCIGGTVMMEFEPDASIVHDGSTQVVIRYRSVNYLVTSRYFDDISSPNRALFAYQLIGNVYAKNKSDF